MPWYAPGPGRQGWGHYPHHWKGVVGSAKANPRGELRSQGKECGGGEDLMTTISSNGGTPEVPQSKDGEGMRASFPMGYGGEDKGDGGTKTCQGPRPQAQHRPPTPPM